MARKRQARKCHAHYKSNGKPCGYWAMDGQLVCNRHGGKAAQNLMAAKLRKAERLGKNALARLGVEPVNNALEELARIAGECVAWKDTCATMVNKLAEDEIRYSGLHGGAMTEQIRAEIVLWERALDRCVAVLSSMARLNLDERLARIEERKADMLAEALTAALADAGLSVEVAGEIRRGFARRLVAIAS